MSDSYASSEFGSGLRRRILIVAVLSIALVFIGRLFYMQILHGEEYQRKSERVIRPISKTPLRGEFFDRNGKPIVQNTPYFSITITPHEFRESSIPLLSDIIGIETAQLEKLYEKNRRDRFRSFSVLDDPEYDIIATLEENADLLPGVAIEAESKRDYNFEGNCSHLLGYVREISPEQLESEDDFYVPGDFVGRKGLERKYEFELRGEKGVEYTAYNALGQRVASFNDGRNDLATLDGYDLNLTLDIDLQTYCEQLMEGRSGAIVALDPRNGEVLAMVSAPDFDIRHFSGSIPAKVYNALRDDPEKPLLNRPIYGGYPPGSTFKMFVGLMGLQEGLITHTSTLNCQGFLDLGRWKPRCHGGAHGNINLERALQVSCNVYFYKLARQLGMEPFERYGKMFGFGSKTSIDVSPSEEKSGLLPTPEIMDKMYKSNGWTKNQVVNWGIGQGEITVTPLQLAVYTSVIANRGTWYQPHAVRSIYRRSTGELKNLVYAENEVPIAAEHFDVVRKGMYDVVNVPGGTALNGRIAGVDVCGKTGTAQNPHGRDHSWFTCFAPLNDPQIVVTVISENAGFGTTVAVPLARKTIKAYMGLEKEDPGLYVPPVPVADTISVDSLELIPAMVDTSNSVAQ